MTTTSTTTTKIFTDRSRIQTFQRCNRLRYLEYHEAGTGVVPAKKSLPLVVGGAVHTGLEVLLRQGQQEYDLHMRGKYANEPVIFSIGMEDAAVTRALSDFHRYTESGLELDATELAAIAQVSAETPDDFATQLQKQAAALGMSPDELAQLGPATQVTGGRSAFDKYLAGEQAALVEAMVRAYARRRLRKLLEEFEVLEVEREGVWKLDEWTPMGYVEAQDTHELWFMSRPDAILRERSSNQLYILSFKTTGQWDIRKERDAQHDMQGLSEGVEVERRLGEWWQQVNQPHSYKDALGFNIDTPIYRFLKALSAPPRILGIRYEYLLKGDRWKDKDLSARLGMDVRSQRSHLIRRYVAHSTPKSKNGAAFSHGDVCWSWDHVKEDGSKGALAWQNWRGEPVWESPGGVKHWIDQLDASVETMSAEDTTVGLPPRPLGWKSPAQALGYTEQHPLDAVFVPPVVVYRSDDELRDWVEQVAAQERRVAEGVAAVQAAAGEGEVRGQLNVHFPQTRSACEYPGTCQMAKICWSSGDEVRRDPVASGLYSPRVPNHPVEGGGA